MKEAQQLNYAKQVIAGRCAPEYESQDTGSQKSGPPESVATTKASTANTGQEAEPQDAQSVVSVGSQADTKRSEETK